MIKIKFFCLCAFYHTELHLPFNKSYKSNYTTERNKDLLSKDITFFSKYKM